MISANFVRLLQGLTIALVIVGYPFFAALSVTFDLPSTPVAIAVRAAIGAFAILLMFVGPRRSANSLSFYLFAAALVLWGLYLLRTAVDTYYFANYLLYAPLTYWLWGTGGSLAPMIALAWPGYERQNGERWFLITTCMGAGACLLASMNLSTMVETDYGGYNSGRASLANLNPIALGHLGVQMLLLVAWRFFLSPLPMRPWHILAGIAVAALGLFIVLSANSRGPLAALVGVLLFALIASNYRRKWILVAILLGTAAIFAPLAQAIDDLLGTAIYERLIAQSQLEDVNTQSRFDLFGSASQLAIDHPFTGSGLEDASFGGYPHNIVIESFMATGFFGGFLMVCILILGCIACYRILRQVPELGWLALLLLQQAIGLQFSGSLAQATTFWGLVGVVIGVAAQTAPSKTSVPMGHVQLPTIVDRTRGRRVPARGSL